MCLWPIPRSAEGLTGEALHELLSSGKETIQVHDHKINIVGRPTVEMVCAGGNDAKER